MELTNNYSKINVVCLLGDSEAFEFADSIAKCLRSHGKDVKGVDQAVFIAPVVGQFIEPSGDILKIVIGRNQ